HGRGAPGVRTTPAKIGVSDERFVVRSTSGTKLTSDNTRTEAYQQARRLGGVALHADDRMDLAGVWWRRRGTPASSAGGGPGSSRKAPAPPLPPRGARAPPPQRCRRNRRPPKERAPARPPS